MSSLRQNVSPSHKYFFSALNWLLEKKKSKGEEGQKDWKLSAKSVSFLKNRSFFKGNFKLMGGINITTIFVFKSA